MKKNWYIGVLGLAALIALGSFAMFSSNNGGKQIVLYSSRAPQLIVPILEFYEQQTGVKVVHVHGKDAALIEKLKAEGESTPADILMAVDAGNLWYATKSDLLMPIDSNVLRRNIPQQFSDTLGHWFGFSKRVRTIVYSKQRVQPSMLSTYEDLASEKWRNRLCLRTSKKVYNQSLVAMMIHDMGEEKTFDVVSGWVQNLAHPPFSSDTKLIQAIEAGKCDVGIVNSYYLGRLHAKNEALSVGIFWPNQDTTGVHVNITGAGAVVHSKHKKEVIAFLEWLSSEQPQKMLANLNMEYPVKSGVKLHHIVRGWGQFKENQNNLSIAGYTQKKAVRLMDRALYK